MVPCQAIVIVLVLVGCVSDVPDTPSFQLDVMPILAANCVRCHGDPRLIGPAGMRLDSYRDVVVDDAGPGLGDDEVVAGAATLAPLIATRILDDVAPMPPRFGLDGRRRDVLIAWWGGRELGDPPPRGEPRPGNRSPQITIEVVGRDATSVSIGYELHDPDGDLVAGELRFADGSRRLIGPLHSGRGELVLDTAGLSGTYPVFALADDGAEVHELAAGEIDVGAP
jgi:hypothetical protein